MSIRTGGNIIASKGTVTIGGGTDKHFTFEQAIPAMSWVIVHNLNKYPSVSVTDSAGSEVICEVEYDSLNQVTLTMSAAFAGKAYLN